MAKQQPAKQQPGWSVPVAVHEIPDAGLRCEIEAEESVRAQVAAAAGVRSVPRLQARFDLRRQGADSLRLTGTVSARVGQTCVVTLEPMESEIEEAVDIVFTPPAAAPASVVHDAESAEDPEPLTGDTVDLGAVATEFLLLGIDPYPRKPGARFEPPPMAEDPAAHPFAALAALKSDKGSR